ncbi:hypothetical protein F5Y18DRAFT_422867 [Xylariaceae sp. FL1019]|nr:hypothetical protein F5Y18DRAFT_422867 [Xylariaceae sp. FL1019]
MAPHQLLLWLMGFAVIPGAFSECYFPGGAPADSFYPCGADSDSSGMCCHSDDVCTEHGVCVTLDTNVPYRGACTDKGWSTAACPPKYCSAFTDLDNVEAWILKCNLEDQTSCCYLGGNGSCCGTQPQFEVPQGSVVAVLDSSGNNRLVQTTTSSESTSGITAAETVVITQTATAKSSTKTAPAVIGLGVALGIAVLAGLLGTLLLWRKLRSERLGRRDGHPMPAEAPGHLPQYSQSPAYHETKASTGPSGPSVELPGTHAHEIGYDQFAHR